MNSPTKTPLNTSTNNKPRRPTTNEKTSPIGNEQKKRIVFVDIPFVGRPTTTFGKKLVNIAKQANPSLHVQPIPRPPPKIQTMFPRKDPIQRDLLSNVVYNVNCSDCSASYIGKTSRQVSRRFEEHGQEKHLQILSTQPQQEPEENPTHSQRPKRKVQVMNYASYLKDYDRTIDEACLDTMKVKNPNASKSSILQHHLQTGHSFDWNNWKLLSKDRCFYRLLVQESLQISRYAPSLNRTVCSVPLIIYPDGPSLLQPKFKMKTRS